VKNSSLSNSVLDSKHLEGKAMDIDMGANNQEGYKLNWQAGKAAFLAGNCIVKIYTGSNYQPFTSEMSQSDRNSQGQYWWDVYPFHHIHVDTTN